MSLRDKDWIIRLVEVKVVFEHVVCLIETEAACGQLKHVPPFFNLFFCFLWLFMKLLFIDRVLSARKIGQLCIKHFCFLF